MEPDTVTLATRANSVEAFDKQVFLYQTNPLVSDVTVNSVVIDRTTGLVSFLLSFVPSNTLLLFATQNSNGAGQGDTAAFDDQSFDDTSDDNFLR